MDLEFMNSQAIHELPRPLANYGKKQCRYNFLETGQRFQLCTQPGDIPNVSEPNCTRLVNSSKQSPQCFRGSHR